VRDCLAGGHLGLRLPYVSEKGQFIQERLVGLDVEQHRRTPAMLRQNHRAFGVLDLLHYRGGGPELGEGVDI
jgi:hypothetical protein